MTNPTSAGTTDVMTPTLDPAAVETPRTVAAYAAGKAFIEIMNGQPKLDNTQPYETFLKQWNVQVIEAGNAAITAFIAAIEPQLRRRMKRVKAGAAKVEWAGEILKSYIGQTEGETCPEREAVLEQAIRQLADAEAEFFALFGLKSQ